MQSERREPFGYPVGLVGESNYQSAIRRCSPEDPVMLFREPGNPHDSKAIVVTDADGRTLGYIPRDNFFQRVVHEENGGGVGLILSLHDEGQAGITGVVIDLLLDKEPLPERAYVAKPEQSWIKRLFGF